MFYDEENMKWIKDALSQFFSETKHLFRLIMETDIVDNEQHPKTNYQSQMKNIFGIETPFSTLNEIPIFVSVKINENGYIQIYHTLISKDPDRDVFIREMLEDKGIFLNKYLIAIEYLAASYDVVFKDGMFEIRCSKDSFLHKLFDFVTLLVNVYGSIRIEALLKMMSPNSKIPPANDF